VAWAYPARNIAFSAMSARRHTLDDLIPPIKRIESFIPLVCSSPLMSALFPFVRITGRLVNASLQPIQSACPTSRSREVACQTAVGCDD